MQGSSAATSPKKIVETSDSIDVIEILDSDDGEVLPTSLHVYRLLTESVENTLPCQNLENKVFFRVPEGQVSSVQRNALFIHYFVEIRLA